MSVTPPKTPSPPPSPRSLSENIRKTAECANFDNFSCFPMMRLMYDTFVKDEANKQTPEEKSKR